MPTENPNEKQNVSDKFGPMTTPGGLLGGGDSDASPQAINNTVQVIGPLPDGAYTIIGDVDMYVLSGKQAALATLSAADVVRLGVPCPAGIECDFNADPPQSFIAWTRNGSENGTDFRCNRRDQGLLG